LKVEARMKADYRLNRRRGWRWGHVQCHLCDKRSKLSTDMQRAPIASIRLRTAVGAHGW